LILQLNYWKMVMKILVLDFILMELLQKTVSQISSSQPCFVLKFLFMILYLLRLFLNVILFFIVLIQLSISSLNFFMHHFLNLKVNYWNPAITTAYHTLVFVTHFENCFPSNYKTKYSGFVMDRTLVETFLIQLLVAHWLNYQIYF
jgi:hypothetical protein